jgi:hypothetical protein
MIDGGRNPAVVCIQKQGHLVASDPFRLDLYRLLCMVLADRLIATRSVKSYSINDLQDAYLRTEVTRILISCATGLRILLDQSHPQAKAIKVERISDCGKLYPSWPKRKSEVLKLRAACNKIIHATDIRFDVATPDKANNPDEEGAYILPRLYLYGKKDRSDWRAVLSIFDFVKWGAAAFPEM